MDRKGICQAGRGEVSTHRGSCTTCARPGEENALHETLGVQYDVAALKRQLDREELARRPAGLWRYRELLPVVDPAFRIDLGAGGTRLVPLTRISEAVAGSKLLMKMEGSNPTGSFKDRPIGVAACVALEQGARGLACLTSGNIGSAMAAVAAKVGVPALVLLLGAAGLADQGGAGQRREVRADQRLQGQGPHAHRQPGTALRPRRPHRGRAGLVVSA